MPRNWSWGKKRKSGYRSGAEEKLAAFLSESKIGFEYETLKLNYEKPMRGGKCGKCGSKQVAKIATYTPDFILENGVIIEYKGRLTSADRSKYVAVAKSNPTRPIVFIFGSDNYLHTGPTGGGVRRNTDRYSDWARANGFDYSIKVPKPGWLVSAQRDPEGPGVG